MGNETRQVTSFFNEKQKKKNKKLEKQGKNTHKKNRKTREKKKSTKKNVKQDVDEVSGNADNGNKFSTRFWEMQKTETRTKTRSSRMS